MRRAFIALAPSRTTAFKMLRKLPRDQWHTYLGDPTIADAVLDRLVHNAYPITLKGPSRRKENA